MWQAFKSAFSCRERREARTALYIMTIGVIDECRKWGIGTLLLREANNLVIKHPKFGKTCKFVYLHVATYNESGIRFYDRNRFTKVKRLEAWYEIFGKPYDALLYYKRIEGEESSGEVCS